MNSGESRRHYSSSRPRRSNVVRLVSGPWEFRWKSVIARVEYVLECADRICVVVLAAGNDPRLPSKLDILNAKLTAAVVSRQIRFRLSDKPLTTYLKYAPNTQLEVEVDLKATTKMITEHLARSRLRGKSYPVPTPALSFLLNMRC